jgi:hypothetical protein
VTAAPLVLAVVLATAAAAAEPSPVEIRASATPDTGTIGTRVRYTVEIAAPPDVELLVAQPSERLGEFEIVDFGLDPPAGRDGKTVLRRWYTLVGWTPGHHLVPSPPVRWRPPGEALRDAPGIETRISIESLLERPDAAADIHDVKGPEPVPVDWRPFAAVAGTLAALVAAGAAVVALRRRRRRPRPAAPARPAHEVAVEALEALRARGLVQAGAVEAYYVALSGIVRTYLEQRFALRAPEMTTEEFLVASARRGVLAGPHRTLLGAFLAESDLVKFARHRPAAADAERAWAAARRFVDETRVEPAEERRAAG